MDKVEIDWLHYTLRSDGRVGRTFDKSSHPTIRVFILANGWVEFRYTKWSEFRPASSIISIAGVPKESLIK